MPSISSLTFFTLAFGPALATAINDFSCKGTGNPVVLLHALGANSGELLPMQNWLQKEGYCTFAQTYGAYDGFDLIGGLKPINESASEIASYINQVVQKTGSTKVDLVGHSEGAFESLYVPKFEGVSQVVDKIIAISPSTHGASYGGLTNLAYLFGNSSRALVGDALRTVGCSSCDDLAWGGAAISKLNDGKPIAQSGNTVTVIASKDDHLVTPPESAFVNETGVSNVWIQDSCPLDIAGHFGEAWDLTVWNLVKNGLDATLDRKFDCAVGLPLKRSNSMRE